MLRSLVFNVLAALAILAAPANSTTYRYSFDVIDSEIGFQDEIKFGGGDFYNRLPWYLGERESYIRTYHSIGHLFGMTGRVVMDVKGPRPTAYDRSEDPVSCVSGDFCLPWGDSVWVTGTFVDFGSLYIQLGNRGFGEEASLMFSGGPVFHQFSCSSPEYPECKMEFWLEIASFTIANFSRIEVAPVPLPTPAPLLTMGLLGLGMITVRRRGRTN